MSRTFSRVIHWFRRDLRLTDNTALHHAAAAAREVVPVYVISDWKKEHRWTGPARQEFLCGCLAALEKDIGKAGGQLIFRRGQAVAELEKLILETKAEAVFTNRDPDPHGIEIEKLLAVRCGELGVEFLSFKDTVLHEGSDLLNRTGKPYRVFGPYNRAWQALEKPPVLPRVEKLKTPSGLVSLPCPSLKTWELSPSGADLPEAGEAAARKRLENALQQTVAGYAGSRNTAHGTGTSRLSADFRHGTLSVREMHRLVTERMAAAVKPEEKTSLLTYLNELAWREFYMQILRHFPEVLEHEFNPVFRGMPWRHDEEKLQRWREGRTGFPIVDAGMREVHATGFMHNRLRMITAMFLTKDLHQDWRAGEQFFMQNLVDGEIASNNGGWQWSAGTGADAAPYFRIQNPWTQTEKCDPDGQYIRRWVPELRDVPLRALMNPPAAGQRVQGAAKDYPPPMLDHSIERDVTLEIFSKHRAQRRG